MRLPENWHWSYSSWSMWHGCPYRYAQHHLKGVRQVYSYAATRGTAIHAKAEQFLRGNIRGLPKDFAGLEPHFLALKKRKPIVEKYWGVDRKWRPTDNKKKTWCVMKMDAAVPPGKEPVLILVDFKTGKEYPSHEDQGSLYAAIGHARYPDILRANVEFWYTDFHYVQTFKYGNRLLPEMSDYWIEQGQLMMTQKKFPKTPSQDACRFCSLRSDKGGKCQEWRSV